MRYTYTDIATVLTLALGEPIHEYDVKDGTLIVSRENIGKFFTFSNF